MIEHRISQNEIDELMLPHLRMGIPADVSRNLSITAILSSKGINFRIRSILATKPPMVLPPCEVWQCPQTLDWVVRQGHADQ